MPKPLISEKEKLTPSRLFLESILKSGNIYIKNQNDI